MRNDLFMYVINTKYFEKLSITKSTNISDLNKGFACEGI